MLYFLTGITASGKSSVAHQIAIERNIPILSLDSMAVYKGLDILSAKPNDVMQAQVKYLGINIADPDQNFSVVDYLNYLLDIDFPKMTYEMDIIAVGGTGLYFSSMIKNYEFRPTDPTIRAELEQLNYGQLMKFHEIYKIELPSVELNKRRLIRNIESSLLKDSKYVFPKLNIPNNHIVVGSFQKDGEGWKEGLKPKLIKGPDIFIDTIKLIKKAKPNLFVLLLGPSRGFVKKELEKINVKFSHVYEKDYLNPAFLNTCYSFSSSQRAFSITSWYKLNNKKTKIVSLGSSTTKVDALSHQYYDETRQAYGWYENLVKTIYG